MSEDENRSAFEGWISHSPYERSILRYPKDERRAAWPGHYIDNDVQVAWEAWCERGKLCTGPVALEAHTEDAGPVPSIK